MLFVYVCIHVLFMSLFWIIPVSAKNLQLFDIIIILLIFIIIILSIYLLYWPASRSVTMHFLIAIMPFNLCYYKNNIPPFQQDAIKSTICDGENTIHLCVFVYVLTSAQSRSTASRMSSWWPIRETPRSSSSWWVILNSCSPPTFSCSKFLMYCSKQSSKPWKEQHTAKGRHHSSC